MWMCPQILFGESKSLIFCIGHKPPQILSKYTCSTVSIKITATQNTSSLIKFEQEINDPIYCHLQNYSKRGWMPLAADIGKPDTDLIMSSFEIANE